VTLNDPVNGSLHTGRFVSLQPIAVDDYPFLLRLFTDPEGQSTGRLGGVGLNPETLGSFLWSGVLTQFLVVRPDARQRIGLVAAYNAEFRHGRVSLAIWTAPPFRGRGWPMEATLLMLRILFDQFPFRKVYFESIQPAVETFGSALNRFLTVEGVLKEYMFVDGRYVDQTIASIRREDALPILEKLLP
jgi:hypothetical protein